MSAGYDEGFLAEAERLIDEGELLSAIAVLQERVLEVEPVRRHLHYLELASDLRLLQVLNACIERFSRNVQAAIFRARLLLEIAHAKVALDMATKALINLEPSEGEMILLRDLRFDAGLQECALDIVIEELLFVAELKGDEMEQTRVALMNRMVETVCKIRQVKCIQTLLDASHAIERFPILLKIAALLRAKAAELTAAKDAGLNH